MASAGGPRKNPSRCSDKRDTDFFIHVRLSSLQLPPLGVHGLFSHEGYGKGDQTYRTYRTYRIICFSFAQLWFLFFVLPGTNVAQTPLIALLPC